MVGPMRPHFVLFGSSIVQRSFNPEHGGWGATLANLYARQVDVDLRGYEGWNSRQALHVLHQVFPKHSAVQPSLVIVYFGGNDSEDPNLSGAHHVPLSEYVENMRKIVTHLTSLSGDTRLIFLSVPPVNEEQIYESYGVYFGRNNESGRAYSEACIKLCQEMGVKIIDLFAAFQKEKDWEATCFVDGIHLTATGNKIVANEILNVLKGATEWKPNLYYESLPSEFGELGSVDYKSLPFEFGEDCLSYDPEIACEKTTYNQTERWPFNLQSCQNLGKIGYMDKPTSYHVMLFIFCCFLFVTSLYGLRCYE